jgi:hypothetical protein
MLRVLFCVAMLLGAFSSAHAFQFKVQHSGSCLDVRNMSLSDGAKVIQWRCHATSERNQWFFPIHHGGDLVTIQLVVDPVLNIRKCLDVSGGRPVNRSHIIQYRCHYGPNQLWQMDYVGDPYTFRLRSAMDRRKCMDVHRASHTSGASVVLYDCHPANSPHKNQIFRYHPI